MGPASAATVDVHDHILNPAEAEIWITVQPVEAQAEAELRGRLVGPHCHYARTVEVAYPLRRLPWSLAKPGELSARVNIPEPSFWDPEAPLLYHGSVEIWKAGSRQWAARITHGLRMLQLGKTGLRCNGRGFTIHGVFRQRLSAEDALELRGGGYNTLVVPVSAGSADLWQAADRFGFFVLGRLSATEAACRQAENLKLHACCLGWLLPRESLEDSTLLVELARLQSSSGQMLGLEIDGGPPDPLPQPFQFIFARKDSLPLEAEVQQPVLLKVPSPLNSSETLRSPAILGWIAE